MDGVDIFKKQNGKSRIPKTLKKHSRKTTGKRKGRSESFKAIDPGKTRPKNSSAKFCTKKTEENKNASFVHVY